VERYFPTQNNLSFVRMNRFPWPPRSWSERTFAALGHGNLLDDCAFFRVDDHYQAGEVDQVDASVGCQRGRFELVGTRQGDCPFDFPRRGLDARQATPDVTEHKEIIAVERGRGHIGRHFASILADPGD